MGSYTQASKPITTTNEFKNIYVKDICNNQVVQFSLKMVSLGRIRGGIFELCFQE